MCAARYGVDCGAVLSALERDGDLVRGELRPGGTEREWCDPEVLRRLRRASLAVLRKEVEPVDQRALAPLPARRGRASIATRRPAPASTACARCSCRSRGSRCRPRCGSATCCRAGVGAYSPAWMDQLCASGELVWIGAGALGRSSGRVALYFREDLPRCSAPPPQKGAVARIRPRTTRCGRGWPQGACFFTDLLVDVDLAPEELQEALWDLVWAGEVDERRVRAAARPAADARASPAGERASGARPGAGRFASRRRGAGASAQVQGRWSLTESLFRAEVDPPARRRALAELLLERYGILTREQVLSRGRAGWVLGDLPRAVAARDLGRRAPRILRRGTRRGPVRAARERSSGCGAQKDDDASPIVLAAVDPAQPYGAALPWPTTTESRRVARVPGAYVVLAAGDPIVYLERGGRALQTLVEADDARLEPALAALVEAVRGGRVKRLALEKVDGASALDSRLGEALVRLGFQEGPRRLTLSA